MAKGEVQRSRRREGDFRAQVKRVTVAARRLDVAINKLQDSADDSPAREELAAAARKAQLEPTGENLLRLEQASKAMRRSSGGRGAAQADVHAAAREFRVACAEAAAKAKKYEPGPA